MSDYMLGRQMYQTWLLDAVSAPDGCWPRNNSSMLFLLKEQVVFVTYLIMYKFTILVHSHHPYNVVSGLSRQLSAKVLINPLTQLVQHETWETVTS